MYECASNAYHTDAPMKQRMLPIFNFRRQLREILDMIMLDYIAADSFESSSSNEEGDIDFILCELICKPINDEALVERLKLDVKKSSPT